MSLERDIDDVLDPLLAAFRMPLEEEMFGHIGDIYASGYEQTSSWGKSTGGTPKGPLPFEGPPMKVAVDWAQQHAATLVTRMDVETKKQLAQVISDGIANKRGPGGLTTDIKRSLGWMGRGKPSAIKGLTQQGRAMMIARTETASALTQGSLNAMHDMGVTGKEVVTNDPCEICQGNEAVGVIPVGQAFPSGEMGPPFHPNCLLPDVRVEAPHVVAGSRVFYDGQAVEISMSNGQRLAVTPNHMILTESGFVPAQSLSEGDYVICCTDGQGMIQSVDPHNNNGPAAVSDIWDALVMQSNMVRGSMPISSEDFHGDGRSCDGDVNIVWSERLLLDDSSDAPVNEHIAEVGFGEGCSELSHFPCGGGLHAFFQRTMAANNSGVGVCAQGAPFTGGQLAHVLEHGGATATRADTGVEKPLAEDVTADSRLARQLQLRFARFIAPQQVTEVRNFNYSGHVYDLQTVEHWYITNGIVTHNCECALAPVMMERK